MDLSDFFRKQEIYDDIPSERNNELTFANQNATLN